MGRARARAAALVAVGLALLHLAVLGCGETRQPIGEECLRDEDCLSNVCSARTCVPAPQLTVPYGGSPDDEPRIPAADGASAPSTDAGTSRIGDASRDGPG